MKFSPNISKIVPPRAAQILVRPRLVESLSRNEDKKLVLILGQAAQGKSTLALSFIQTSPVPSAWLNLDPEDSDAVNLFYLLIHALQRTLPKVDLSSLLSYPAIAMGPRDEVPLYREWVQSLLQPLAPPVRLVFDGLNRLHPDAAAFRFLQVLVDEIPPPVQLLLISREMPPLEVEALQARREAFTLTSDDLAFTLEETGDYFTQIRRLSLAPDLMRRIHELTEGWIGGIVLLCDSLDWVPESQREKYISGSLTRKFMGGLFQYFGKKIFASLPVPVQEFLVKSSILDIVEPAFMKEFTGLDNAGQILDDLARRNLFVQRIFDKHRGWLFRYHQLFREFLQSKFETEMVKEQQETSYLRAGSLAEPRGELEDAVKYYLQARAYAQAVPVVQRIGLNLLQQGRTGDLYQWLSNFPDYLIQENPWLLFYLYMSRRFSGEVEHVLHLQRALELFEQAQEVRGELLALAYLLEASIFRGNISTPLKVMLNRAETLLEVPASEHFLHEKAVLWLMLSLAHMLRSGNPRKGVGASQSAYLIARDLGDVPLQISALIHAHGSLSDLGEFAQADETVDKVEKLMGRYPYPELRSLHLLFSCQLAIFRGDLPRARALLKAAQEETEKYGLMFLYHAALVYELILLPHLGEFARAEEIGNMLLAQTSALGNIFMQGHILLYRGVSCYHQGNLQKAAELLGRARQVLSTPEGQADSLLPAVAILSGLIACRLKRDPEPAEAELQEALAATEEISSPLLLKEIHLALALLHRRQGRLEEAAARLAAGFKIAAERGYFHYLYLNREDLAQAAILALELDVAEAANFAVYLLSTRLADLAGPRLRALAASGSPQVARRAGEVSLAIHRARVPRLRLQTLGGFHLWRGSTPMEEKEWGGNQPRLLLKVMIARGGAAGTTRDLVLEDLWPEAAPNMADRNFKVNLHRLRKALEPGLDRALGSSYVHLKANLLFLDRELCQVDVDEFLSLFRHGERKEGEGDIKGALAFYKEAADLYRGDFLPEDLYAPWAEEKREELRRKFIEVLFRLSRLYEKRGTLTKAIECCDRIIQTDPTLEQAYQNLMVLYANRGMRSAAVKVYEECKKALKAEVDAEPDRVTHAIFQKIMGAAPAA